jgi:hypothetical protein
VIEKQRKKGRMATAEEEGEEEEEEKENARVRGRAAPCVDGTKRVPRTTTPKIQRIFLSICIDLS